MLNELRARVTYKAPDEDDYTTQVLGEQEQEEILEDLRKESKESKELYYMVLRILVAISTVLQLSLFIQNIPISKFLLLCNLILHFNTLISLTPTLENLKSTPLGPIPGFYHHIPISYCLVFSTLASCISAITTPLWLDRVICLETPVILGVSLLGQRWIRENEVELVELQKLQFPAKGA